MICAWTKRLFRLIALGAFFVTSISPFGQAHSPDTPGKRIVLDGKTMAQRLKYKVDPIYPAEARRTGIEGIVKLRALIATDGSVKQLQVDEGHPLLVKSALEAAKQWTYEPVMVDGEAVEVVTSVSIVFQLRASPK